MTIRHVGPQRSAGTEIQRAQTSISVTFFLTMRTGHMSKRPKRPLMRTPPSTQLTVMTTYTLRCRSRSACVFGLLKYRCDFATPPTRTLAFRLTLQPNI